MRSVNNANRFSQVPRVALPRSTFDRSHAHKTTFNAGYIMPVYVDEALPGDTINMKAEMFARLLSPLKQPILDNMFLDIHYFAVPYRLVYEFWEEMNGEQANPDDPTDYLIPQIVAPASVGVAVGTISDVMGIPVGVPDLPFSALWHRGYNLIWNTWYRDENLQDSVPVPLDEGPDTYSDYTLLKRAKRDDYFTRALPFPQKGPDVLLPLGGLAPVVGSGGSNFLGYAQPYQDQTPNGGTNDPASLAVIQALGNSAVQAANALGATAEPITIQMISPQASIAAGLNADLSNAAAATLNMLRESVTLQHLYELDARGGTRYTEIVKNIFGVSSPDERLQRPEYLGGGTAAITLNPVAQTSGTGVTGGTTPLGNLAAIGTVIAHGHGFSQSFTEHGYVIGLVNVRADLTYQQGVRKMWTRSTRYDFYFPAFAMLGEQAILNKEIYSDGSAVDNNVFGYQERWAEYRYSPSQVSGLFRSTSAGTLDAWHLAQKFTSVPGLGQTFIEENPPLSRILAVGAAANGAQLIFDSFFDMKVARPMPLYSVPGLIDHF